MCIPALIWAKSFRRHRNGYEFRDGFFGLKNCRVGLGHGFHCRRHGRRPQEAVDRDALVYDDAWQARKHLI